MYSPSKSNTVKIKGIEKDFESESFIKIDRKNVFFLGFLDRNADFFKGAVKRVLARTKGLETKPGKYKIVIYYDYLEYEQISTKLGKTYLSSDDYD